MHYTFAFLVNKEQTSIESLDYEELLDDNNWSQELCLVTRQGELIPLCPEDDWRDRAELQTVMQYKLDRWEAALTLAREIYENDIKELLGIYDPETLQHDLISNLQVSATKTPPNTYKIKRIATLIDQVNNLEGVFTNWRTNPYETVLHTIKESDDVSLEDENVAILFVDIHT